MDVTKHAGTVVYELHLLDPLNAQLLECAGTIQP